MSDTGACSVLHAPASPRRSEEDCLSYELVMMELTWGSQCVRRSSHLHALFLEEALPDSVLHPAAKWVGKLVS